MRTFKASLLVALLAALSIGLAGASSASAALVWSNDFDSFAPDTGDGTILNGDATDVTISAGVLDVGTTSPGTATDDYLQYQNLTSGQINNQNGRVRVEFNYDGSSLVGKSAVLFMFDDNLSGNNYAYVMLNQEDKIFVRAHQSTGSPAGEVSQITPSLDDLASGAHVLDFTWEETVPPTGSIRGLANLIVSLDGTEVLNVPNAPWIFSSIQSNLTVGSFRSGGGSFNVSGHAGVTLDSLEIFDTHVIPEPNSMLLVAGAAVCLLGQRRRKNS